MKAELPRPEHFSYQTHRRQMMRQIVLPVALAAVLMIGMIVLISFAAFRDGGDVGRWAAISTIWIVIPILLAGLVFLAILAGLIYLVARLLGILPTYTGMAQDYVHRVRGYIVRGADMVVRPVIAIEGFVEYVKALFGRK